MVERVVSKFLIRFLFKASLFKTDWSIWKWINWSTVGSRVGFLQNIHFKFFEAYLYAQVDQEFFNDVHCSAWNWIGYSLLYEILEIKSSNLKIISELPLSPATKAALDNSGYFSNFETLRLTQAKHLVLTGI